MMLFLAGLEAWWKYFDRYDIKYVLASYYSMRNQRDFAEMVAWLEEKKANDPEFTVFLDSGAFTFQAQGHGEGLDGYADEYINWLKTDPAAELFDLVAELDVYVWEGSRSPMQRVRGWRRRLLRAVGKRLVPVLHWENQEEWEQLMASPKYDWLAISSIMSSGEYNSVGKQKLLISQAHRHGKKVHGFGMTRMQTDVKYLRNYDSVDSTSWLRADKYGATFIYNRGHLRVLNHLKKEQRAWHKGYFSRIGLDPKMILGEHIPHSPDCPQELGYTHPGCRACKDRLEALRASSLIAWRGMQQKLARAPRSRRPHNFR